MKEPRHEKILKIQKRNIIIFLKNTDGNEMKESRKQERDALRALYSLRHRVRSDRE